jgi:glycosyltransferase involved in cell wall biosynthesis
MATDLAIFLATSGHSGVDRLAKNLVPALARRGYRIDLLQVRGHGPYFTDIPDGVRLIDLGTRHVYPSLPALVRYLRRERPASLLCDKDRVNHTALLARALAGSPTYLALRMGTTVSIDLARRGAFERWKTRQSMGRLYPLADNILVVSEGVADDMAAYTGLPRERITVVPSPIFPASLFAADLPRPDHPWFADGQPPVILGVGEPSFRKDFETLIRAFARLRPEFPSRLMILGRGRRHDSLLALARELGVAEDVALPGFVDNPFHYLAHARLFAFTSRWEGMPFALVEALAVGVPVVATDCPSGPREVLHGGKYGPLVPVGDAAAFAAAMLETLRNPLPRTALQEAARPYEFESATTAYAKALNLRAADLEPFSYGRGQGEGK